ncbi:hypothetical protein J4Q44_G00367410 [Coregonus suidteri]|uniref:Uncharacterized protein n=1 Tax=Coregonus suidteri TaxID=861788 RepID=A0AAN8Q6V0_9TELE
MCQPPLSRPPLTRPSDSQSTSAFNILSRGGRSCSYHATIPSHNEPGSHFLLATGLGLYTDNGWISQRLVCLSSLTLVWCKHTQVGVYASGTPQRNIFSHSNQHEAVGL